MLKLVLFMMLVWASTSPGQAPLPYLPGDLSRSDLNFLFDSIGYENDQWKFKPSINVRGARWSVEFEGARREGLCTPDDDISVPDLGTFTLEREGTAFVASSDHGQRRFLVAMLTVSPKNSLSHAREIREGWLRPGPLPDRGVELIHLRN